MADAVEAAPGVAQTAPAAADDAANSPPKSRAPRDRDHDERDRKRLQRHLQATVGRLFARNMHVGLHGPLATPPNLLARSSDSSAQPPIRAISGLDNAPRRPTSALAGSRPGRENLASRPASAIDGSVSGGANGPPPKAPTPTAALGATIGRPGSVAGSSSGAASTRCCMTAGTVRCSTQVPTDSQKRRRAPFCSAHDKGPVGTRKKRPEQSWASA
jgi:hypothetical protein